MKIIRYADSRNHVGYAALQADGSARKIAGNPFQRLQVQSQAADVRRTLAPVEPSMIWGIGINYRRHAEESKTKIPDYPIVFAKGPNAVQHPGEPIWLPGVLPSAQVDYEGELAVVIGRTCKNVPRERALDCVLGYTCANDISARDWQIAKCGGQWCRGKTFDSFAPLGPCLVTADEIPHPNRLRLRTEVNGEVLQDGNTDDMIFDVPALIAFLSASTTLAPGTVILTGTPHGVGMARTPPRWLRPGDSVTVDIEGIGRLTNPVSSEHIPACAP